MTEYLGGKNSLGRNLTMMTDFYELTMMQGYLRHGLADNVGVFDMFFRSRSDGQIMYAVMAGVEQLCEYIENLHFDEEDVAYLRSQNVFDEEFLKRLSDFEFTGEIYAVPEGTPVFPGEPIVRVRAPLFQAQLIETALLNIINHQTLIATKASRSTDAGNFVQYNCSLSIPANITDELTPINYSVVVSYDGLKSAPIPLNVKAWHYKYFVVEIDDAQTTVDKGLVTFAFTINAERLPGDGVYHTTVDIVADSLQYELEKMSETAYKCRLAGLASGVNKIAVKILEQGCPPVIFPYEVYYTPAKGRSRSSAATPEEVTIMRSTTKRLKITRPVIIETAPAEPEPAAPAPVEETVAEPAPSIPETPAQEPDDPSQEYKRKVVRVSNQIHTAFSTILLNQIKISC